MPNWIGILKGSRTLDSIALAGIVDAAALGFLMYSPEQLHVTVPVYAGIRIGFGILQAYLRFQTSTPVGEKPISGIS